MNFAVFRKVADHVILAAGWKRRIIAFLAGASGALAMAPLNIFIAMLIPMTIAVWLIDGAAGAGSGDGVGRVLSEMKNAAGAGWWLGFGYFFAGLWWLGAAFLVEADDFAWALPLAVLGLPAILALFTAIGFAVARALWTPGAARLCALSFGLGGAEWARGQFATGFPWNEFGMTLGGNIVFGQIASLVGLYGLNTLTIVIFASPAALIDDAVERNRSRFALITRPPLLGAFGLAIIALFGAVRLGAGHVDDVAGVRLRIMQPDVPQGAEFRPENKDKIIDHYLSLSDRATSPQTTGVADVTHLFWPESAFPFILSRDAAVLGKLTSFLGPATILITGAARMMEGGGSARLPGEPRRVYYNSVQAIDRGHSIFATYDKMHLVPFGEYLPFSGFLEKFGIRHLVHVPGGFEAGTVRKLMTIPGLPPVSALVCYEAVFPGEVTTHGAAGDRPGVLVNLSEDGWYGKTAGPFQHFSQARLRAIEEGLPLVRAANTGISAIVDPYGRVVSSLPVGVDGVIDGGLPKAIEPTLFANWPLVGPTSLLLLSLMGALAGWFRRRG